jgi:uncharacterized protein (TIGR03083 family)
VTEGAGVTGTLTHDRYCAQIGVEADRFAETLDGADWDAIVPTCPDWTLRKLTKHVGRAHRWATAIVVRRASEFVPFDAIDDPRMPAGEEQRWLRDGATRLADALRECGPDEPVWSWSDERRSGFWARRMVHETVVHRADLTLARQRPYLLEPEVAADGLDEWLGFVVTPPAAADRDRRGLLPEGSSMLLAPDDAPGRWRVRGTTDGLSLDREDGPADVTVRADVADLLLLIMRRRDPADPAVEVRGDAGLLDKWLEQTKF